MKEEKKIEKDSCCPRCKTQCLSSKEKETDLNSVLTCKECGNTFYLEDLKDFGENAFTKGELDFMFEVFDIKKEQKNPFVD